METDHRGLTPRAAGGAWWPPGGPLLGLPAPTQQDGSGSGVRGSRQGGRWLARGQARRTRSMHTHLDDRGDPAVHQSLVVPLNR